nr:hypothetical protein [Tanacetum cinerariifolium]
MGRVGSQPFHLPPNLNHQKKDLHPEFPGPEERIVDFLEGKVKIGIRPCAAHEVPLLTVTASRVIEMEDPAAATDSSGIPSTIERSPLDFANENPSQQSIGSTVGGKSVASIGLETGSTFPIPTPQDTPADFSDPDPLLQIHSQSLKKMLPNLPMELSLLEIQSRRIPPLPPWSGHPKAYTRLSEAWPMRHLYNDDFLRQYNINLARQVAMGSHLRLRIQAKKNEIKNLEVLLEAETDMKKAAEAKNAELVKELENLRALFTDLQVSNDQLPQQVFADVVSAGIAKGMSEGLKYEVEHGKANLDLEAIEAYDPEADTKYVATLHALRDLKYPMVDQLKSLKDAPIDVIMASLHLESDSGEDAPQWIRELRPSSSQLKIHVYPEVRDPKDPWSFKEDILLVDVFAANVSRAEKKKKCRVVCHTYGVGSAYHARSDDVLVSVPTVAPQGLAILLADVAKQTETPEDGASPRLLRSKSLPAMCNLD